MKTREWRGRADRPDRIRTAILEVQRPKIDRANDPRYNFYADPSLDEIIAQQGKAPVTDLSVLHGDRWPEEEPIEAFLAALHEWRGRKRTGPRGTSATS